MGARNSIIGIREVYVRQGRGGTLSEVINTIENASCRCKIVSWEQGKASRRYFLRNELLDNLPDTNLRKLLDENSILLRVPQNGLIKTAK